MFNKIKPETVVKIAGIVGTALSLGGTLLSGWAGNKKSEATIAKEASRAVSDLLSKGGES